MVQEVDGISYFMFRSLISASFLIQHHKRILSAVLRDYTSMAESVTALRNNLCSFTLFNCYGEVVCLPTHGPCVPDSLNFIVELKYLNSSQKDVTFQVN